MATFLLLLLIFFVIIPLCKLAWRVWTFRRRYTDMQRRMADAMRGAAASGAGRAPRKPQRRKKKIDPAVGEYVTFEEVHSETSQVRDDSDGTTVSFKAEEQIEEAVWEEIR